MAGVYHPRPMPAEIHHVESGVPAGEVRLGIVVSRYNEWITQRLLDGALEAVERLLGERGRVMVCWSPGAFELPVVAAGLMERWRCDGVVCLGCIIKGETSHDVHLATSVATALQMLAVQGRKEGGVAPVGFGVLTVDTAEQGEARAGGAHGNKGAEAVEAVLQALGAIEGVRRGMR